MFPIAEVPRIKPALCVIAAAAAMLFLPNISQAQRVRDASAPAEELSAFNEFKGVRLGMTIEEARQKLGNPANKSEDEDLYMFGEKMTAQVLYNAKKVVTISVDFMTPSEAPNPKEVVGSEVQPKADGSMHKMVRYPKAGYWVSYSRTAGDSPMVSVTIQKIDQ